MTIPLALVFIRGKPLKTVGVHGMLPENFHSMLFGALFEVASWMSAATLIAGLSLSFGERLPRLAAMIYGSIILVGSLVVTFWLNLDMLLSNASWSSLDTINGMASFLVFTSLPVVRYVAAYAALLVLADRHERKSFETRFLREAAARPALFALALVVVSYVLNSAMAPLAYRGMD
ncbi:MAG TPA: hypothetical protein VF103_04230 [Polyangiaceae bacterium]